MFMDERSPIPLIRVAGPFAADPQRDELLQVALLLHCRQRFIEAARAPGSQHALSGAGPARP